MSKRERTAIKKSTEWVWNKLPLFFALLTLFWILLATVIWPSQNVQFSRKSFDLKNGPTLEVWGPIVVQLETPVEIHFTLHQKDTSSAPLTLRVKIPEDLVVLSPVPNPLAEEITLSFTGPSTEETLTIQVANAKQSAGLGVTRQRLQIEQGKAEEQRTEPTFSELGTFQIKVEQTWRGVLRQGGGGTMPLGPLITLVTSLGTLFYQYITHSREEREYAKKAEKEKEAEAWEGLQKIRQALKDGNAEAAEKALKQIERKELVAYVDANQFSLARQLIELANGKTTSIFPDSLTLDWTEPAAGAILYAAEHNPINRSALETLMHSFPIERLCDEHLKTRWNEVRANIGANIPLQAREWPRPPAAPWPVLVSLTTPGLSSNPFPADRAEEEERYLFSRSKSLFWSNHPMFETLKERRSAWIVGEGGSGKTALALATGKYLLSDDVFSEKGFACYFRGLPPIAEIRRTMTGRLLDSLLQSPSHLPIGEEQNRLLAEVLLTALSASLILGRIKQTTATANWDWLKNANETQRAIWQAEARSRLRLLEEAVRKSNPVLPESLWPQVWSTASYFLGFEVRARLVFDLDAFSSSARQKNESLEELARWAEYGIYTFIFSLPQRRLEQALGGWTSRFQITWNEKNIKEMAYWRWKQVYPERPFATLFDSQEAEGFFFKQAQGNPARLIRLWNRLFQSGITFPVTQAQITTVAESS